MVPIINEYASTLALHLVPGSASPMFSPFFSPIAHKRFQAFWSQTRSRYALIILSIAFLMSLPAEFIANSKPLIVMYQGELFVPVLKTYKGQDFGQNTIVPPDYKAIKGHIREHGWMIMPPIAWGRDESNYSPDVFPGPPSAENWLGTDDSGRDVFVRLLYGFRLSMLLGLFCLFTTALMAVIMGGLGGYLGGKVDLITQRFVEIWAALPPLFVILLLSGLLDPSPLMLMFCLSAFLWTPMQYYLRGECLRVRNMDYVHAAVSLGATHRRIFFRHVLANSLTPLITLAPFVMNQSILALSFLDFLGLGVPAPTASLGELLRQGKEHILQSWWLIVYPLTVLSLTLLMLNFIGDGIREAFDPRAYSSV